jgi:hypothetical protein
VINPAEQHHLHQNAHRGDRERGDNNAAPETQCAGKPLGQRERHIGAEHVECAMGKIDDPRHAKDNRQARSDQKQ